MKLAYVMSRFPKITETFILYEILELEQNGVAVEVFPLMRESQGVVHPEAEEIVARAHYQPTVSLEILRSNWRLLRRSPRRYLTTLAEVLWGTRRNVNFLAGAVVFFPKAAHFADEAMRRRVTHVHGHFANHPALVALVMHRLADIPFSFTAHGSDIHVRQVFLTRKIEASRFVVTISSYNKEFMIEHCGERFRDKIHVVHCGVDPRVFTERGGQRPDGPFQILCVASYEEVKGHPHLIAACGLLREQGLDFACHLVGEGPLREEVEAQIRSHDLAGEVFQHGALPRERVARMMREADVVVLPSVPTRRGDREGIPVVLMEAMATGLPVVSSRLSGIPELVLDGETGILVPPGDPDGLAAALRSLAEDPQLRLRMGRAGRRRVLEEFDLRENSARLVRLFRRIGAEGPASPSGARSERERRPAAAELPPPGGRR